MIFMFFLVVGGLRLCGGKLQVQLVDNVVNSQNVVEWIWWCGANLSRYIFKRVCAGAWYIWNNRNKVWHGGGCADVNTAAYRVRFFIRQWATKECVIQPGCFIQTENWSRPAGGVIKLNSDGSWSGGDKIMGFGVVARDDGGVVKEVRADWEGDGGSALEAEGKALLLAMELAEEKGWSRAIFETDSGAAISVILKGGESAATGYDHDWGARCNVFLAKYDEWKLSLVPRDLNGVADMIAKKAREECWMWRNAEAVPRCISWWCGREFRIQAAQV